MVWGQGELFAIANKVEVEQTEFYLGKYKSMTLFMTDFENYEREMKQVAIDGEVARRIDQEDLHADKTANAVILSEKQKWVYNQYRKFKTMIDRAHGQIIDEDAKEAIGIRFIQGYSRKETIMFMRRGVAHSTVDRRIDDGIVSIANTLKLSGFFEEISEKF